MFRQCLRQYLKDSKQYYKPFVFCQPYLPFSAKAEIYKMGLTLVTLETMAAVFLLAFGTASPWGTTSPGITDGTSLQNRANWELYEKNNTVTCVIDVENWLKFPLNSPVLLKKKGIDINEPTTIGSAKREAFAMRMVPSSNRGVWGTVSWLIDGLHRRFVIMFSAPIGNYHNWLGMGVTRRGLTTHRAKWWKQMYEQSSDNDLTFDRFDFWTNYQEQHFSHAGLKMEGYMTSGRNARIFVKVKPTTATWQQYAAASVKNRGR